MGDNERLAYLIGVDHRIQYTNASCGPEWKADIKALEDYLADKAVELNVDLLAEEFNEEYLVRNHSTGCTVRDAAGRVEKQHIFCEPDAAEREAKKLNTPDLRESFWLDRLLKSGASSLLFVCGDDHLKSFSKKLNAAGFETTILSENWGNDWMIKQ